ncbi:MAG: NYN domain-containing protein [Acidobacteria bacterium]|nr:NYN domain-containing protein [Acidobacteriota bacterium]
MIFVDHSNLVGVLQRTAGFGDTPTNQLITRQHYELLFSRLLQGHIPSPHQEGGKPAYAFVYIPDEGIIDEYRKQMIRDVKAIPGVFHQGGFIGRDPTHRCRAEVRTNAFPPWRTCGTECREIVEKQVDVALATDLVKFACKNQYDVAFLVTEDRDFIPAIKAAKQEGKTVIHAFLWRGKLTEVCNNPLRDISSIFRPST